MKCNIIEIVELGKPQSIIQRDDNLITELIKTTDLIDELNKQLRIGGVVKSLPTKDEIISEGAKQINDWLEGNTEREKQHYLIGFRRSYEYVLRRLK